MAASGEGGQTDPSQTDVAPANPVTITTDDSDPDFDDLDDVLDQFSANAPAADQPVSNVSQPTPSASGPGRPTTQDKTTESTTASSSQPHSDTPLPTGQKPDESEEEFVARLSKEMSAMFSSLSTDPAAGPSQSPEEIAKMGKELEEFTQKMEKEGIQPEDLLKALLGEDEAAKLTGALETKEGKDEVTTGKPAERPAEPRPSSSSSSRVPPARSFEDTIRSTMSRLETSNSTATEAAQKSSAPKTEEDLLADMLRALDTSGSVPSNSNSSADPDNLSNLFLSMMHQLTHKSLLYEPMSELNAQYPLWLSTKKPPTISQADHERYTKQSIIVDQITKKFEEKDFSDDDAKCREYIWDKMQEMQELGAPPDELVKNPLPGTDLSSLGFPGLSGLGGLGGTDGEEGPEEGCPTQ